MKTLVCTTPGSFEYRNSERPVLSKGSAIIRIKRIGICGTDLHAFEGTQPYFEYPRVLGHELAGELVDADSAPGFRPGEKVTIIPYFNCGECVACRNGKPNCCVNIKVCGVHIDGGMAEYLSVPANSLVHADGLGYDELALLEPLAIGAHGVRRAGILPGEFVMINGAGPIGLGTAAFAKIAGAKVIIADTNQQRLNFCQEHLRADYVINASSGDVYQQLNEITSGDMPTAIIDATGSQAAINKAFDYLAHSGRYILVGLQKGGISFSHPEFHKREATLMSSRNATREDFEYVMNCMKAGLVKPTDFITHRMKFSGIKEKFPILLVPEAGVIKAIAEMD